MVNPNSILAKDHLKTDQNTGTGSTSFKCLCTVNWRKMLFTDAQIDDYLTLKHELPNVECKAPGKQSDNPLFGKVIRAAMGMANRPDGGIVIIGVAESAHVLCPEGLADDILATWHYDDIADGFNAYAEPQISFEYQPCEWNGRKFLILHIHEFTDVPVLCKKDYRDDSHSALPFDKREKVLRKGLIYARSLNKAETKEIDSVESMRAVLDLAIRKGIQKFVEQTQGAGLSLTAEVRSRNEELFREQREHWESPLITEIQSRGSFQLVIRPERFAQERIDFGQLYPLIRDSAVHLRSHSFPFGSSQPTPGEDWISGEFSQSWVIEAWRLYQSGQFVYLGGILDDWRDRMNFPLSEGSKSGTTLTIEEVVYRCTEFFEFASRLALADGYQLNGKMHIEIIVAGLKGRVLSVDRYNRLPLPRGSATAADHASPRGEFTQGDLVAQPKKLALQAAAAVFKRFNWSPSEDYLQGIQSDIG
jgi:hypothetical protein